MRAGHTSIPISFLKRTTEESENMQNREEASYDVSFKDGVGRCVVAARDLEVRDR